MQDLFSRACDGRNIPVQPRGLQTCVSHGVSFAYINIWFIIRRFFCDEACFTGCLPDFSGSWAVMGCAVLPRSYEEKNVRKFFTGIRSCNVASLFCSGILGVAPNVLIPTENTERKNVTEQLVNNTENNALHGNSVMFTNCSVMFLFPCVSCLPAGAVSTAEPVRIVG